MKARIIRTAWGTYARIEDHPRDLDVAIDKGKDPAESLRDTAAKWRAQAARFIAQAEFVEQAAAQLEAESSPPDQWTLEDRVALASQPSAKLAINMIPPPDWVHVS